MFRKRYGVDPPEWAQHERALSVFAMEQLEGVVAQAEARGEKILPLDTSLPAEYVELFERAYAPHNRRLGELTGLDLSGLGYPI